MAYPSTYKYSTKIKGNYIRTIILYRDVTTVTLVNEATITHNNYIITIFSLSCIYIYIFTHAPVNPLLQWPCFLIAFWKSAPFAKRIFFPHLFTTVTEHLCLICDVIFGMQMLRFMMILKKRHSSLLIHIIMNIIDICKRNIHLYANKYMCIYI